MSHDDEIAAMLERGRSICDQSLTTLQHCVGRLSRHLLDESEEYDKDVASHLVFMTNQVVVIMGGLSELKKPKESLQSILDKDSESVLTEEQANAELERMGLHFELVSPTAGR